MDNSLISISIFIVITIFYFVIKYYLTNPLINPEKSNKYSILLLLSYFILTILIQFFINVNTIKNLCGFPNYSIGFFVTFIPWVIIFGILIVMLKMFASWKLPFSNTIGYLITKIGGINTLLTANSKDEPSLLTNATFNLKAQSTDNSEFYKAINNIKDDPAWLINEFTPNPTQFNEKLKFLITKKIFKPINGSNMTKTINSFKKLVYLKDLVAECIWFILTGCYITMVSRVSIMEKGCKRSLKEMQHLNNDYSDKQNKEREIKENEPKPQNYLITN